MTPKMTQAMQKEAIADGAEVSKKRKVQKPPDRAPAPVIPFGKDRGPEIEALRGEIVQLKQALADEKKSSVMRSQELVELLKGLNENKPLRLKPIRDMDRESPTYLLVSHYDFIPITYQARKLDS